MAMDFYELDKKGYKFPEEDKKPKSEEYANLAQEFVQKQVVDW